MVNGGSSRVDHCSSYSRGYFHIRVDFGDLETTQTTAGKDDEEEENDAER